MIYVNNHGFIKDTKTNIKELCEGAKISIGTFYKFCPSYIPIKLSIVVDLPLM